MHELVPQGSTHSKMSHFCSQNGTDMAEINETLQFWESCATPTQKPVSLHGDEVLLLLTMVRISFGSSVRRTIYIYIYIYISSTATLFLKIDICCNVFFTTPAQRPVTLFTTEDTFLLFTICYVSVVGA